MPGAYAHVCALPDRAAALRYDEPEVQQVRRDALAWWIPMLGDDLVCLSTFALDASRAPARSQSRAIQRASRTTRSCACSRARSCGPTSSVRCPHPRARRSNATRARPGPGAASNERKLL